MEGHFFVSVGVQRFWKSCCFAVGTKMRLLTSSPTNGLRNGALFFALRKIREFRKITMASRRGINLYSHTPIRSCLRAQDSLATSESNVAALLR
jgi:hypothetical protein